MASIEKRTNGSYRIVVACGYDSKGKKIREYCTVPSEDLSGMTPNQIDKEINRRAVLFEQKVKNGTFLDGEKITFSEFAKKWLADYAEKQLAPGTLKSYKMRLEQRVVPALGHLKMAKIQPHHLLEFYNNLGEGGIRLDGYYKPTEKLLPLLNETPVYSIAHTIGIDPKTYSRARKGERINMEAAKKICVYFEQTFEEAFCLDGKANNLSSKTIKHHHDLISAILGIAVEWGVIINNPAERVKAPKVTKAKSQYYDDSQVIELFAALDGEPLKYKTMIYLTIDTGIRLSELAGLEWKDIDFDKNSLIINKQRQYVSGYGTFVKEPKTVNGNRYVSISSMVIQILKEYRVEQKTNRLKVGNLWADNDYIFIHEDGSPMYPNRPYQWFQAFIKRHKLPKITFHALRHTNASLLIAEGVDVVTLSERLGHADKNVTLNIYSHIIKSKEKQAANKLDDFYTRIKSDEESGDLSLVPQ